MGHSRARVPGAVSEVPRECDRPQPRRIARVKYDGLPGAERVRADDHERRCGRRGRDREVPGDRVRPTRPDDLGRDSVASHGKEGRHRSDFAVEGVVDAVQGRTVHGERRRVRWRLHESPPHARAHVESGKARDVAVGCRTPGGYRGVGRQQAEVALGPEEDRAGDIRSDQQRLFRHVSRTRIHGDRHGGPLGAGGRVEDPQSRVVEVPMDPNHDMPVAHQPNALRIGPHGEPAHLSQVGDGEDHDPVRGSRHEVGQARVPVHGRLEGVLSHVGAVGGPEHQAVRGDVKRIEGHRRAGERMGEEDRLVRTHLQERAEDVRLIHDAAGRLVDDPNDRVLGARNEEPVGPSGPDAERTEAQGNYAQHRPLDHIDHGRLILSGHGDVQSGSIRTQVDGHRTWAHDDARELVARERVEETQRAAVGMGPVNHRANRVGEDLLIPVDRATAGRLDPGRREGKRCHGGEDRENGKTNAPERPNHAVIEPL